MSGVRKGSGHMDFSAVARNMYRINRMFSGHFSPFTFGVFNIPLKVILDNYWQQYIINMF